MTMCGALASALLLAASGCASDGAAAAGTAVTRPAPNWRNMATENDRERLRDWRSAWTRALEKAQAGGQSAALAAEDELLNPDKTLPWQAPPPGLYRCRTLKLGSQSAGMLDFVGYPAFDCQISSEDGVLHFTKLTGSQRPIGLLLPQTANRMVFLGTLQLGDETRALDYGHDTERDLAAIVERIGERKWRMAFPYPHFESLLDVIELVPKN